MTAAGATPSIQARSRATLSYGCAERQKRWRDKLRAAAAAAPSGDRVQSDPDRDIELRTIRKFLETAGRERDAAIKRCHQLEAELREAQKRGRQLEMELLKAHSVEISARMYRLVRSFLHPDRVVDPAAKEYLHRGVRPIHRSGREGWPRQSVVDGRNDAAPRQDRCREPRAGVEGRGDAEGE